MVLNSYALRPGIGSSASASFAFINFAQFNTESSVADDALIASNCPGVSGMINKMVPIRSIIGRLLISGRNLWRIRSNCGHTFLRDISFRF